MESSISGFKVTGSWQQIVEHGEKVQSILMHLEQTTDKVDEDLITEFKEWRPKVEDLGDEKEISKKTAEKASVSESTSEKKDKPVSDDIDDATEHAEESMDALSKQDINESWKQWKSTTAYITRATDTIWRQLLRKVEFFIYTNVMTIVSPYYFDNPLISANIQKKSKDTFEFEVNINDDDLKDQVKIALEDLNERERWHLNDTDNQITTEKAEASEGPESISDTPTMDTEIVKEQINESLEEE